MLAFDEVPVWWLATDTIAPADLCRWLNLLDEDERDRADRFWQEADRREFIAAHALLRSMLTYYANQPAKEWRFSIGTNGKPEIASDIGGPELQFNLSHTRGLVAAAISSNGTIGIDAEKIDRAKFDSAVADAFFAPAEVGLLRRVPEADRPMWFFRLWTLKEAYIKAIGTGVSMPLRSFAFAFEPIRIRFASSSGYQAEDWHFNILPTTCQHILSVAAHRAAGSSIRVVLRAVAVHCL